MRWRHVPDEGEHELRCYCCYRGDEGYGTEHSEVLGHTEADPECGGEGDKPEDEGPAFEEVAQWAEEEEAGGVAGLGQGWDVGGLLVGYVECSSEFVEDWMGVVEVCYGEAACECWRMC